MDSGEELMPSIKRVMDYSHLNYYEVLNLPCDVFLLMARNSYIDELNATEQGRDYLEKCRRIATTEMDEEALSDFKQKGGGIIG